MKSSIFSVLLGLVACSTYSGFSSRTTVHANTSFCDKQHTKHLLPHAGTICVHMVFISSPRGDHCLRMGCSPCPHNVALCSQSAMLGVAVGATLGIIVAMLGTTGVPTTDLATVSPVTSRGALRVGSYASGQYPRPFLRSPQDAVLPPLHAVEDERADMESLAQGEQPPVDSVSRISRVPPPPSCLAPPPPPGGTVTWPVNNKKSIGNHRRPRKILVWLH